MPENQDPNEVRASMLRENYSRMRVIVYSFPILAAVTAFALRTEIDQTHLQIWYGGVIMVTVLSLLLGRTYRRQPGRLSQRAWGSLRVGSSAINALVWGISLATFLFPTQDLGLQVFCLLLVGGTTGIAITSSASYLPSLVTYQLLNITPLIVRLLVIGSPLHQNMAGLAVVYLIVVLAMGLRVNSTLRRAFTLELHNQRLVESLTEAKADLETANRALNQEMDAQSVQLRLTTDARQLSESRLARVHALMEFAGIGILVVDADTLEPVDHNGTALRLLGCAPGELPRSGLRDLLDDRGLLEQLTDGHPRVRVAGELEYSFSRRTAENSDLLLVLVKDVKERQEWEQRALQAQKMEAIGRLAGEMAHDFNNLLMAISGYAGLLPEGQPSDSEIVRDAEQILAVCERGKSLTAQLLAFSDDQSSESRVLDLNAHVRGLDGVLGSLLGEPVELVTLLCEQPCPVNLDPGQFDRVLLNLMVNAREAMEGVGAVTLRILKEDDRVVVEVQDSGPGIETELREQIFQPFFSTKSDGSGLGLTASVSIMERLNGELRLADSESGARFRLSFPACAPTEPELKPTMETRPEGLSRRILVVEDQDSILTVVCRGLEKDGYRVVGVHSAEEAMEVCEQQEAFDLVISDVILPKMSGLEFFRRVQKRETPPPFVLMSGYVDSKLDGIGDTVLLRKPFRMVELLSLVASTLNG